MSDRPGVNGCDVMKRKLIASVESDMQYHWTGQKHVVWAMCCLESSCRLMPQIDLGHHTTLNRDEKFDTGM